MSTFDPAQFENTVLTEANDTRIENVPAGEYLAQIKKYEFKTTDKGRVFVNIQWETTDPAAVEATGLPSPVVRQTLWLDTTEGGQLDMGKGRNVQLGKLREALGMNTPGRPFSWPSAVGQMARIQVKHEADKRDPSILYANVSAVTKA